MYGSSWHAGVYASGPLQYTYDSLSHMKSQNLPTDYYIYFPIYEIHVDFIIFCRAHLEATINYVEIHCCIERVVFTHLLHVKSY